MPETIRFGTDGWRGIIAEDFTFAAVRRVTQALALELRERVGDSANQPSLVVGFDTRFGSSRFAAAVAEVLAAHDIHVYLCQAPVPSQVISCSIVDHDAHGGVMITASHNPASFNGYKIKGRTGAPASASFITALEERIAGLEAEGEPPPRQALEIAEDDGNLDRVDLLPDYVTRLGQLVDLDALRNAGLTVAVDAMHGAGAGIMTKLFADGTTKVIEINGNVNPTFPNIKAPEPIAVNLTRLGRVVQDGNALLGLAFDSDADRVGVVGKGGSYVSAQTIFALLTLYLLEVRGWSGPIVKSHNATAMVDELASHFGVEVHETPVGFTAMAPVFQEHDAIIAGEESGGFAVRHHIPDRDGILSGLFLLDLLVRRNVDLGGAITMLEERVGKWFYERQDIPCRLDQCDAVMDKVRAAAVKRLAGVPIIHTDTSDGVKYMLEDGSWLLVRFSGTEAVLRLYAEARSQERVGELLNRGRELSGL